MLQPKFDFHEPSTVAEACQIKAEYGENAKLPAGGTDLLADMKGISAVEYQSTIITSMLFTPVTILEPVK